MVMQHEAIFEAPAAHEASHYSNPEWETEEEGDPFLGNILGAVGSALGLESEDYSSPYSNPEWEDYSVAQSEDYSNPEWEDELEADALFGKALKAIKSVARRVAPMAARALGGMIPGVGAIAGPMLGQLARGLLGEAEMEASQLEAALFGHNESVAEVASTEAAHEAALTELLAAEAAESESTAEAEATLAAALPITITIMGARRRLRPVVPAMTQANARLVQVLRSQGAPGRQLLRTVPAIQRRAVATIRAAARAGQPVTGQLATRAMATAARRVLGSPRQVQRAIVRNTVIRQRVAPTASRRAAVFAPTRATPYHPRRAAGYRPMSPVAR